MGGNSGSENADFVGPSTFDFVCAFDSPPDLITGLPFEDHESADEAIAPVPPHIEHQTLP